MHMFNNRIEVIADAYVKNISNLILVASGSGVLGGNLSGGYGGLLSWPTENYGGMENKGFGITVNTVSIALKIFNGDWVVISLLTETRLPNWLHRLLTQYYSYYQQ